MLRPDEIAAMEAVERPEDLCRTDQAKSVRIDLGARVINPLFCVEARRVLAALCPACRGPARKGTGKPCKLRVRGDDHDDPAAVILECATDDDLARCAVNVPLHALTLIALVVPPMVVRPSATLRDGQVRHDDLTLLAQQVARAALRVKRLAKRTRGARVAAREALQAAVARYYGKGMPRQAESKKPRGPPRAGIKQRLTSKTGRFRNNMLGWRTNRSCRAVAGPRNDIGVGTVALPMVLAHTIGVGDGDYVLVNRQPTLHQASMVALRVRVEPGAQTIGVNTALCAGYNLDFDGDELNCWALGPRHGAAAIQARLLLGPENHPRSGLLRPTHETGAGWWLHTRGASV